LHAAFCCKPTTQCSLEVVDEKKTAKRLKGSKCPLSRPAGFFLHQQLPGCIQLQANNEMQRVKPLFTRAAGLWPPEKNIIAV
jgi:hypothetical protein